MTRTRILTGLVCGLVIGVFLFAARAAGQPPDDRASHVPVPLPPGLDLKKLLDERLMQSERMAGGQKFRQMQDLQAELGRMLWRLQTSGDGERTDIARRFRQMLQDNPGLREQLTDFARRNPEMLDIMAERTRRQFPEFADVLNGDALRKGLEQLSTPQEAAPRPSRRRPAGERPEVPKPPERGPRRSESPPAGQDPAIEPYRENIARNLSKLAERFDRNRLAGPLRESPAVNHLIERLAKSGTDALRSGSAGEGLDAQLARWQQRLEGLRNWVPERLPEKLLDVIPPSVSELPRPNFRLPQFDFRPPGLPAGGFQAGRRILDVLQFILFALLVLAVGVVLWRMIGARSAAVAALRRRLGPWPLDPGRVANRADLIRAFEYLSLLQCGEKARAWHHRAIADCLGGTEAQRRAAAERLAELYEQARYAPDATALPEPAFADARRHLTYLAGRA